MGDPPRPRLGASSAHSDPSCLVSGLTPARKHLRARARPWNAPNNARRPARPHVAAWRRHIYNPESQHIVSFQKWYPIQ
eukprot:13413671-Alexandrium_andersonii.AAC.1